MTEAIIDGRYIVISADGHAGADLLDYKPYLEQRYHEEFDAWAAAYENPFSDLVRPDSDRNWNSERRLKELESDGIVAEVIFPNTIPPFFEGSSLLLRPPAKEDFDRRWAGLKAHNRWLADFCADTPGRRAGIAQIFMNDVDVAVEEIKWAHGAGLFGGVLVPGIPPDSGLPPMNAPEYEPIWQVCADLDMPVNNHAGSAGPDYGPYASSTAVLIFEMAWFSHRMFWTMVFGGVFDRHPNLKLALTEQSSGWVPAVLKMMDHYYMRFLTPGTAESHFGGEMAKTLSMKPSEYWSRQCFAGASFFRPVECALRYDIGVDNIMWGQDYPHTEGTYPYTREALRNVYAELDSEEVAKMVGGNAARVYGFDLAALGEVAKDIGPTVAELAKPLDAAPADSLSMAFANDPLKPW